MVPLLIIIMLAGGIGAFYFVRLYFKIDDWQARAISKAKWESQDDSQKYNDSEQSKKKALIMVFVCLLIAAATLLVGGFFLL